MVTPIKQPSWFRFSFPSLLMVSLTCVHAWFCLMSLKSILIFFLITRLWLYARHDRLYHVIAIILDWTNFFFQIKEPFPASWIRHSWFACFNNFQQYPCNAWECKFFCTFNVFCYALYAGWNLGFFFRQMMEAEFCSSWTVSSPQEESGD